MRSSVFFYDLNFQKIKVNLFDKIILPEPGPGMLLKIFHVGIQPDGLTKIKGIADVLQTAKNLVRAGILRFFAEDSVPEHVIVFPELSP